MKAAEATIDDPFVFEETNTKAVATASRLRPYTAAEFLELDIPIRNTILAPWLPEKGLAMLVAPRGIGKTFFTLTAAYAIACGGSFLGFTVAKPHKVFYLDGEMPGSTMQERMIAIIEGFEKQPPAADYFKILSSDLTEDGLPDLSTAEGQALIDEQIGDSEVVIVDNLSTLMRSGKENEAESWSPVQEWVLKHRRQGRSVLMVHHAGKNGTSRGTSKREDVLDTVISLRRPEDYTSDQGARFEVHFDKARGFYGESAQAFEARYEVRDDAATWTRKTIDDVDAVRVADALNSGLSIRDAAAECGLSRSKTQRLKETAKEKGLLDVK